MSAKGVDKYLLNKVVVKTQDELDALETAYINETNDDQRRVKKAELKKHKRERSKSLAAAAMLTNSVKPKDLKILAKCKLNPKSMYDVICKKYYSS